MSFRGKYIDIFGFSTQDCFVGGCVNAYLFYFGVSGSPHPKKLTLCSFFVLTVLKGKSETVCLGENTL